MTRKQEIIITTTIFAITSAIIIVTSNTKLQQGIRKGHSAATGIEPDNAETVGPLPSTNII